ncbi:MAG: OB-fold domain-containing protein [Deltaproteobacteria bacterium]|nr:OB-fold domain-containing protein [Deltaproteobacteria bacterium]
MAGISALGVYIPCGRLDAAELAVVWGRPMGRGKRAVAHYDEDTFTLAVEAASRALRACDPSLVRAAFFATTTPPLHGKSLSALLGPHLDLPAALLPVDLSGARSGATALLLAGQAVAARGGMALVVAADQTLAAPGHDLEAQLGDAAVACLVTTEVAGVTLLDSYSTAHDFPDLWRRGTERFVRTHDLRYALQEGFAAEVGRGVAAALRQFGLTPEALAQVVLASLDQRSAEGPLSGLGFNPKAQLAPSLNLEVGLPGCAAPLLHLAAALGRAKPGDRLLLVAYGDGVDVLLLQATEQVARLAEQAGVARQLAQGHDLPYPRYLQYRGLIEGAKGTAEPFTSLTMAQREQALYARLHARVCPDCGAVITLDLRVCPHCQGQGPFAERPLSRRGTVFAFTHEHYFPCPDPPLTVAVVDLEGGGRLSLQMTEADHETVKVGDPVRLTLRRLHEASGYPHYYWKCTPA